MNAPNWHGRKMRPPTIAELVAEGEFPTLEHVVAAAFAKSVPAENLTVTDAALKYTKVSSGGNYGRPWSLALTPYLKEPQDVLTSLEYQGMVFIGPARTGKTVMGLNFLGHTVIQDPTDMLYVHMNRDNARKWSKGDLDRFLSLSPDIRDRQLTNRKDDNTFDKEFDSGMRFLLTYPTIENLSGITVKYVFFMDYDRMDDDIDGEGNPYDLGSKRTTTFQRFAMTAAESSPNPKKEISDPQWIADSPHQAPPIPGIFELYNRGDRRMRYWQCLNPKCREWFEPDFRLMKWVKSTDVYEASESAHMDCPHCGHAHYPRDKATLEDGGRWLKDGQMLTRDGELLVRNGMTVARSDIASFWLKGPSAGYQTWKSLVLNELRAQKAYENTGDEGPLRKTRTTDQGTYYIPKSRLSERTPEDLMNKKEFWETSAERPTVPGGVRFLIATVDVQARAFVVQVHGFTATGDIVVIDSFKITKSNRRDQEGDRLPVEPGAFDEDWDMLLEHVVNRQYDLADGSGRKMAIRATGCDSGGQDGVTTKAYDFWRHLKTEYPGLHRRFILVKGMSTPSRPRVQTTWPDSHRRDKWSVARGDVPVCALNSNILKDQVAGMLQRRVGPEPQPSESGRKTGMIRYPHWMPSWFYRQMTNEVRTEKGWVNPARKRNEVFDLLYYALALAIRPFEQNVPLVHFGWDRIDFHGNCPSWASEWDGNDFIIDPKIEQDQSPVETQPAKGGVDLSKLEELGNQLL